jgi:hypothetical protein
MIRKTLEKFIKKKHWKTDAIIDETGRKPAA